MKFRIDSECLNSVLSIAVVASSLSANSDGLCSGPPGVEWTLVKPAAKLCRDLAHELSPL